MLVHSGQYYRFTYFWSHCAKFDAVLFLGKQRRLRHDVIMCNGLHGSTWSQATWKGLFFIFVILQWVEIMACPLLLLLNYGWVRWRDHLSLLLGLLPKSMEVLPSLSTDCITIDNLEIGTDWMWPPTCPVTHCWASDVVPFINSLWYFKWNSCLLNISFEKCIN